MGTARIFCITWQYNMGRSCRNGSRTYLLFCGRCIPAIKRRFSDFKNSTDTVSYLIHYVIFTIFTIYYLIMIITIKIDHYYLKLN